MEDWDKINAVKDNKILLNMAINHVLETMNYKAIIEEQMSREEFKRQVSALHKVFKELHMENK